MEEVSKPTKEMIEDKIRECIDGLKYVEQGDKKHTLLVADIKNLVSAYTELEKTENAKIDSDRKFGEEIREKDMELYYKDELERDKLHEQKKAAKRDAMIKIAGIVIPTSLYFLFLGLGMKLEFIDHGAVTSFSVKELMKALHPKPTIM